jgi:hypothetical protein
MHIPMSWAIALVVAGAMAVVVALGIAARRGVIAAPERALAHVAYLLGGGLTGFMALAFPPAWPLLAAVVGMLVIRAFQMRRILDIGLLTAGFGSAWTLLLGLSKVNAMTDPAVHSPDVTGWFLFAIGVLVTGVVVTIVGARPTAPPPPSSASG